MKKQVSIRAWSGQHPDAGLNIQQIVYRKLFNKIKDKRRLSHSGKIEQISLMLSLIQFQINNSSRKRLSQFEKLSQLVLMFGQIMDKFRE